MKRRLLYRTSAIALACLSRHQADAACPSLCSGHGTCDANNHCTCASGWTSFDCSDQLCPFGAPWIDFATATDTIRSVPRECSNMGKCDRSSGSCTCEPGFAGVACERMKCPNDCSGHGRCVSMNQAGTMKNDRNLFYTAVYTTPWDADRIFGCVCELGFTGPDCSLRECPYGDDPITTGQVDEIQAVSCQCNGCTGTFQLSFQGVSTRDLTTSETAASLKAALEALPTIRYVDVDTGIAPAICSGTGVSALVTFTHEHGDIPSLVVSPSLTGGTVTVEADGTPALFGGTTQTGTKEWLPCSGRGNCNTFNGLCVCEPNFYPSDGRGASGTIMDCGYYGGAGLTACAAGYSISCSSRGKCLGGPNYQCACQDGFYGYDCSRRRCPYGRAWWQEPKVDNVAHLDLVECSNAGLCDEIGVCRCFAGFEGTACERMVCPGSGTDKCRGNGVCKTAREMAELTQVNFQSAGFTYGSNINAVQTWDADMIQGCYCFKYYQKRSKDLRYFGHDCSRIPCPSGDDPWTTNQFSEVQTITCAADGGTFSLQFKGESTQMLSFASSASTIKAALEALSTVRSIEVAFATGVTQACSATGNVISLTFLSPSGNVPLVEVRSSALTLTSGTASAPVVETTAGTTEDGTCNNRGRCDDTTGSCVCELFHTSSDGQGGFGSYGDCGAVDSFATHGAL